MRSMRSRGVRARTSRAAEHGAERMGDLVWAFLRARPFLGVGLAAGAGIGVAMLLGPAELGVGIAASYAAYQVLRRRLPPSEALRKAVSLEKDLV